MRGQVIVMNPAEYQEWLTHGEQQSLARAGEEIFRSLGCSGCHMGSGVVRAPNLRGIYGRPVPLQSGRVIVADDGYLRDSILQPERDIAAGYAPLMPSYQDRISEEDLFLVIAYIKSLALVPHGSGREQEAPR
jgi:cytochrome c oxidase subunit 2